MLRSSSQLVPITTIVVIIALVALAIPWRDEAASWELAAAEERWNEGEKAEALAVVQRLTKESPDRIDWLMKSIKWSLEEDRPEEAIEAADQALAVLESETDETTEEDVWDFTQFKAFALARLGRSDEAMEACEAFAVDLDSADPSRLNGLAYVASLAGKDLDVAFERIDRVLKAYSWTPYEMSHRLALQALDGKDFPLAHRLINRAIGEFEPVHNKFNAQFSDHIATLGAGSEGDGEQFRAEVTKLRADREMLTRRRAMLHSQRAYIREQLGQVERAEADRRVVERLGFSPSELVNLRFVDDGLGSYSSFLDTRAWVQYRRGNLNEALVDMNRVIEVATVRLQGVEAAFRETQKQIVRSEVYEPEIHEERRIVAIFYYHRATIHRALGDELRAFADEIQVRRLGQEPGPHLF